MIVFGKERDYVVHNEQCIKGFFGPYRWLSNYHECNVYYEGLMYGSTEAAYQSAKLIDLEERKKFLGITPSTAKKMGKTLKITIPNWDEIKFSAMSSIVFDKYLRNEDIRWELLRTGDKYLEETNHWKDRFWGVCDNKGENNMGIITMGIRAFWEIKYPDFLNKVEQPTLF